MIVEIAGRRPVRGLIKINYAIINPCGVSGAQGIMYSPAPPFRIITYDSAGLYVGARGEHSHSAARGIDAVGYNIVSYQAVPESAAGEINAAGIGAGRVLLNNAILNQAAVHMNSAAALV